MANNKTELNLY